MGTAASEFYQRQLEVLERVARGEALSVVLEEIVQLIEHQSGGMLCSLLLLDAASGTVRHVAAPNLPPTYVRGLDGSRIGPDAGSCGTAAYLGQRVVVEDIASNPLWASYRHLALPHGIRACWSTPIFSPERQVLGTFAMYYRECRPPRPVELEWVDTATHLAAIAIQHERAQRALRDSEARASQLAKLYAVSSSVNEAIIRLREPAELYDCACRIAVEQGLARLAWVGLLQPASGLLRPVARCGTDDGYVDRILLSLNDARSNRGPAGRALTSGVSALCNDIETDPDFFWKAEALARGLRACAVIPLHISGRIAGAFALYTSQPHSFRGEEVRVLESLAADIAFAVESAEVERERKKLLWELGERVKELTLLHQTARVLQSELPFASLLERLVAWIPAAWQHPEQCRARIRWGELALESPGFRPGSCKLERPFGEPGERGLIEVVYLHDPPGEAFLPEEVELIASLAEMLSVHLGRERSEAHMRGAERLRELIYRSVVDEIFCLAVERDGSLLFASVNPAFLATAGLREEQVIGQRIERVLPPSSLSWAQAQYERAIRSRQSVSWQDATETPAGIRHGEVTVAPIFDDAGRCTNLVGTVRDITQRKRAEEERRRLEAQLQQAQRMQSLGTLAGGIAHDFNNILTAFAGNAELGTSELLPEHPAFESLSEIRKATRRATDLVRQILAFSRQEKPTRRVLDAREVVEEVLRLLRTTLPPSIELERELAADTPAISADGSQLHQVLMNLCTNAAHALQGERGLIRVSSSRCEVDARSVARQPALREGIHCRIVVSDTGCGMDSSTLARAFEPFFTTRPQGQGTGLGLAVVHGIIESHGGAIGAHSTLGKGTSFELYLPAVEVPAEAAVALRAEPSAGAGEHILYVDDDEALVFLAQRLLPRKGYRVTAYTDAALALSEVRAHPGKFDAVVTDVSMPGMSGADLVRELRQLQPELPIVMTSGYIRAEDLETAQRLGVGDLILKPDSVDELVRVLHQKFSQLRRRSAGVGTSLAR